MDFAGKGPSSLKTEKAALAKQWHGVSFQTQSRHPLQVTVTGVTGEEREGKLVSPPVCHGQVFLDASVPPVSLAPAARTKCHTTLVASTTELDGLSSGGRESRMLALLLPAESSEGESVPCLWPRLEWFASSLWHPQTYRSVISISASHSILLVYMSVCKFPFVIRTPVRLEPSLPKYTSC